MKAAVFKIFIISVKKIGFVLNQKSLRAGSKVCKNWENLFLQWFCLKTLSIYCLEMNHCKKDY